MIRRSLLTSLFVLIATASLAAPPPVNPADAAAFMNQLWASAVEVLNKKADPAAREARFRQLFHEDFDCPGIARFVLGRYWRSASEGEQQEFVRLLRRVCVYRSAWQFWRRDLQDSEQPKRRRRDHRFD